MLAAHEGGEIQDDGSHDIVGDEKREKWKCRRAMSDPKNQQQQDMGDKAGYPKQKIYAGQVHLLSLVGQPAQACALGHSMPTGGVGEGLLRSCSVALDQFQWG